MSWLECPCLFYWLNELIQNLIVVSLLQYLIFKDYVRPKNLNLMVAEFMRYCTRIAISHGNRFHYTRNNNFVFFVFFYFLSFCFLVFLPLWRFVFLSFCLSVFFSFFLFVFFLFAFFSFCLFVLLSFFKNSDGTSEGRKDKPNSWDASASLKKKDFHDKLIVQKWSELVTRGKSFKW